MCCGISLPAVPNCRVSILAGLLMSAVALGCGHAEPPSRDGAAAVSPDRASAIPVPSDAPSKVSPNVPQPSGVLPRFTDVATEWGIDFERYDDIRGQHRLLEANGGGVALFDYDLDGWPDVFLTNGCRLPLKEDDGSHVSPLFRNVDGRHFLSVTAECGLTRTGYFQGVAVGDWDNDGFDDFYVTAFGRNALWLNQGDGTFRDVTEATGTVVGRWCSSAAFADLDGDGDLDLYVVAYVDARDDPPKLCRDTSHPDGYVQCPPTMFAGVQDILFLNCGNGTFQDVTDAAGIDGLDGKGLGVVVFDFNGDRKPDIFVANDGTPNFLYVNDSSTNAGDANDGSSMRFREQAVVLGVAVNNEGRAQAGMGVSAGDYDGDGWPDLFVTNYYMESNSLFRNMRGSHFIDATTASGLGPPSRQMLAFGTEFFDVDQDGWLDVIVTNGHVDELSPGRLPYRMPAQLFRNERNGTFREVSAWAGDYFARPMLGRGLAVGDLDQDGDLDVVVSHQRDRVAVLRNDTVGIGNAVSLQLTGTGTSNRNAVGAVVEVRSEGQFIRREIVGGGSFQSASARPVQIGLRDKPSVERVTIFWPDGNSVQIIESLAPGKHHIVQNARPQPRRDSLDP